ncbi:MAG: DUF6125 family protein [Chloroflexota bacterium]
MTEAMDYSGEFNPGLRFEDLPPEFLAKLLRMYGQFYIAIDGFWYLGVKEHLDNDTALTVDKWAWEKATRYELKRLTAMAGITGDGIDALFKFLQLVPWLQVTEAAFELESPHRGTMTVSRCSILEALEREGQGREAQICTEVDIPVLRKYAEWFNPRIRVEPLFLPPRDDRSGICCRWEFTLE